MQANLKMNLTLPITRHHSVYIIYFFRKRYGAYLIICEPISHSSQQFSQSVFMDITYKITIRLVVFMLFFIFFIFHSRTQQNVCTQINLGLHTVKSVFTGHPLGSFFMQTAVKYLTAWMFRLICVFAVAQFNICDADNHHITF